MLAVVFWSSHKVHTYVYGIQFTIESDHKLLEMIALKNIGSAPLRLQRMLLRLHPYNMKINYIPGRQMYISYLLSRQPDSNDTHIELDQHIA